MSNDVINALKRLERAGSESSRATEKLQEAARTVGLALMEQLEGAPVVLHPLSVYTSGYGAKALGLDGACGDPAVCRVNTGVLPNTPTNTLFLPGRQVALDFAALIAGGWIDRQADAVEAATAKAQQATAALEAAAV